MAAMFGAPVAAPVQLAASDYDYVGAFAAVIGRVTDAQNRLVEEVDTASRVPDVLNSADWQARSQAAAELLMIAGAELRIQPLPDSMRAVDDVLAQAQREGELASETHMSSVAAGNVQDMVGTLQHLDRMSQLIQKAYALIPR